MKKVGVKFTYFHLLAFFFVFSAESKYEEVPQVPQPEATHKITHHVHLGVQTDNNPQETLVLGMYGDLVPKTVKNFLAFCTGTEIEGKSYSYVNVPFHRIIPNFMVQGGDIVNKNGTGSLSIYGESFEDENFTALHKRHVIAMANRGPNTNGSQFYITTVATSWLNGHHVVFGELVEGEYVLQAIEATGSQAGMPRKTTLIKSCKVEEL
ncbi:putative peptidyl-prolyl cis-trans isomerase taCyP [Theileria orientalis strain Shintoku]|uniref:Peptidyl-prolyl cis-trans isomerase n=1 Tax=Theileria orientalis strain Shintoku TaxID=869250 RepID=J4CCP7_THEOR|nr:putative peptidyl-prolyl cis-trans isomerase taCyP [Theileria orientalis strain Shintoku]PVC50549.1 putative peptidyl-prolyl cis-trans isomerase taCyP [Theileria orientalis]BAM39762.1 putative peptidyl-prolyl cis-trans isomerase taCyP [Theileria orientalis strain Shintoku]|eukprot:XP_009690063.1 putative peptidyl-prolyl cis-trans isomerase taCyP [Theileria orientalis strain Shintoku]